MVKKVVVRQRNQFLLRQRGFRTSSSEEDSPVRFGKGTVAGVHGGQRWFHSTVRALGGLTHAKDAWDRLASDSAQSCSSCPETEDT